MNRRTSDSPLTPIRASTGSRSCSWQHYEETHPGATVSVEPFAASPGLDVQYATQAAAGTLADVIFTADLFVVPFAQQGVTIDMQPLADADPTFDLSDVYPNMLGLSRVGGEGLYMIPSSYDVVTMYYNKTMFEEAGAPLPTADWTWDDYIASCQIIKEKTGNYCFTTAEPPTGIDSVAWWAYYVPWITGYGGKILSDDGKTVMLSSPETLAGLEAYTDMWTVDDIGQPLDFAAGRRLLRGRQVRHLVPHPVDHGRHAWPGPAAVRVGRAGHPVAARWQVHGHGHLRLRDLQGRQEPRGRLGLREVPGLRRSRSSPS